MKALTKRLLTLGASGIIAVAAGYSVAPWEGKENNAYKDIVGVVTICYGQTHNVQMGEYRSDEECEEDLAEDLDKYHSAMMKHVKVPLSDYEQIAYTSFIWNLGETNWRKSTLLKKLNSGDHAGACAELLRWDKAGGKVVKGLTNRRQAEYKICMGNDPDIMEAIRSLERPLNERVDTEAGEIQENVTENVIEAPEAIVDDLKPSTITYPEVCTMKFMGYCLKN